MRKPISGPLRNAAYTMMEVMVAVGVFAVGASIAYPLLVGDINLYARNFSLNKSNNSLRYSLQMLKRDIDMAAVPPMLMGYRVSGGTGILKPLDDSTPSAQAILVWVNLGPAYDLVASGTGTTITPSSGVTLTRSASLPTVQVGDRLVIMSPAPFSVGMPDVVTMDGVIIQKPGRRINAISNPTATSITVQLDNANTLPANIPAGKSAYIVREVAYVAKTITDGAGNTVERQLIYYPSTDSMTRPQLLVRDLDPTPVETDTNIAVVAPATPPPVQPFNYYGGRGNLTALSVILPIRAIDYARSLNDRNLGGAATNTSTTEFDVYLRSAVQMGIKTRLF